MTSRFLDFFKTKEPPVPTDPRAWQKRWHEILDDYDHPEDPKGEEKGVPDPLPDMSSDYRLHFYFWYAKWKQGAEARKRAFAFMPRGDAMLARIEIHLSTPPQPIDAAAAEALLRRGLVLTRNLGVDAPNPDGPVRIRSEGGEFSVQEAFAEADTPFIHLRDELCVRALRECGPVGEDAYYFLSEPLYRLASTYDVSAWVEWPLCAPLDAADPTEAAYRLWEGGWSSGWDSEGLFLFDRRKELHLI